MGVPIIRRTVFWQLYWAPPTLGNYLIGEYNIRAERALEERAGRFVEIRNPGRLGRNCLSTLRRDVSQHDFSDYPNR